MFRRRSFNYETGNNDDHAKKFSFIFDGIKRSVSPADGITECRDANHGFHSSLANGKEHPTQEDPVRQNLNFTPESRPSLCTVSNNLELTHGSVVSNA